MKEYFKRQLEISKPVTSESLNTNKVYFNNDTIKINDVVLYAFLVTNKDPESGVETYKLISLNENHFNYFEITDHIVNKNMLQSDSYNPNRIPIVKYKF